MRKCMKIRNGKELTGTYLLCRTSGQAINDDDSMTTMHENVRRLRPDCGKPTETGMATTQLGRPACEELPTTS